jgi:uncharacterized membrane protein YeaQ/YmgE (transglycosylase-associated protein family)
MEIQGLAIMLLIGAISGWLAGLLSKGRGFGLFGNIVVGVVGAVIGRYLLAFLGFAVTGLLGAIISATLGALVLLFTINLIFRK